MSETWQEKVERLIGQPVELVLDYDLPDGRVTGVLVSVDVWGEAVIDTPGEGRLYCWPALDLRELGLAAPDPDGPPWTGDAPCEPPAA